MTAYEHRSYWLYCNGDEYRCHQRLDSESGEGLAALRKRAGKAGWTRTRSRLGRKYDKDFCPEHKPAEAAQAARYGGAVTDVDDYREPGDDREPPEPDHDAIGYAEHCEAVHDGKACDCPLPTPEEMDAAWAERARQHQAEDHDGGECDCIAPF